jgi:hypothetical protein
VTPPVSIEVPLPSAEDIERIIDMYDDNAPIGEIIKAINDACPYNFSMASYPVIVGTGMLFSKIAPAAILRSFVSDTSNPVLTDLLDKGEIGQITKMRGGNLRIMVTTKEAQLRLRNQVLTILNKEVKVLDQNPLEDLFYLDIFDVHSSFDFDRLLNAFSEANSPVLFSSFREVGRRSVTMGSFRVYFRSKHCPKELMRNGAPCDQILFGNCLHLVRGKGVAPSATAIPFGKRSMHLLDLDQAIRRQETRTPNVSGKRKREAKGAKNYLLLPRPEESVATDSPPKVLDESFIQPKKWCGAKPKKQELRGWHTPNYYSALADVDVVIDKHD